MTNISGINFFFAKTIPINYDDALHPPQSGFSDQEVSNIIAALTEAIEGSAASIALFRRLQGRSIYISIDDQATGC